MTGGTLTPSTGTVNYNGNGNQTIGAYTYYKLTTSNSGTNTLSAAITVTNNLSIQGSSVLVPNGANRINDTAPIELKGGTYRTGATAGFSDTVGVLTLSDDSSLVLGTGNHALTFAASNAASWTAGKKLTITGWIGDYNGTSAGTNPRIFFGNSATALTSGQLDQIQFFDGASNYKAILLPTGEVVPSGVDGFSPAALCAGATLDITGNGFTGVTAVRVNGVNVASYTVNSSSSITAVLSTSNTTGSVSVVTPNGTLSSAGNVTVNPIPTSVTATPSATSVCLGGSIDLASSATSNSALTQVTLINENFNSATNNWTRTNTSTGGTAANAAWTLRPNGYSVCPSCQTTQALSSNDSSQFYLCDSDRQGSNGTTNTTLRSPAFSTVGLGSASLSFYHFYRDYNANDFAYVEISTNDTNWTNLTTYTSTQGDPNAFQLVTINLASYLNQGTVYIRFRYAGAYGYYWAVDNVSVTGVSSTPPPATFAWTSTPTGYTSSVQNPTGVFPTAAATYTVTATNSYNCSASATTASVAVNSVPTIASISAPSALCASGSLNPSAPTVTANGSTVISQGWQIESVVGSNNFVTLTVPYTVAFSDNGKKIRYTATNGCGTSIGNQVTLTINTVPSIANIGTPAAVCSGASLSPASPTVTANGSAVTSQSWQIETAVGSGSFTNVTLPYTVAFSDNGKKVRYSATNGCGTTYGNEVVLTVNPNLPASVSVAASPSTTICSGTNVTFTATPTNGGTPTYQWKLNGSNVGTNSATYSNSSLANGNTVSVVMTSTATCATGSPATSNTVTMTVNSGSTAAVLSGSGSICLGSPANLQVAITGGASPYTVVYNNGVSNTTVTGYASGSAIAVSPTATTTYTLVSVTSSTGCLGTGNSGSATVSIDSTTSSDGGLSWTNGAPDAGKSVIFNGSVGTISANFAACSLRLTNNAVVTVNSGINVTLNGKLTVDSGSTFTLNNNSNLLQNTTLANSGNIVVKRNSAAIKRLDYTLWSSPVTGQELYAFSPLTFANRFYTYNPSSNNYVAYSGFDISNLNTDGVNGTDNAHAQFAAATGYLIRAPWNHPTAPAIFSGTFTGVPNNGTISQSTTSGLYYAVGNPYPSTIDADVFVSNNNIGNSQVAPGDGLYFWRKTNNVNQATNPTSSYATYTTAGGVKSGGDSLNIVPSGVIQVGEGFIVKATSNTLQFNNGQRIANNANQFLRSGNIERHRIWLNLSDSVSNVNQMMISYMTGATQGVDAAIDGRFFGDTPTALNSIVNNEEFAVQGRSLPFEATDVVPLAFKAANSGNYSIAIDHVDGLFAGGAQAIYLKDNLTNTYHNLNTSAYSFASAAGSFNGRFELVYQSLLSNPVFTPESVVIYSQNDGFVVNSGSSIMASIRVFDIRGRLIEELKGINSNQASIRGGLTNEVLLVQITSEEGAVVTKKVIK